MTQGMGWCGGRLKRRDLYAYISLMHIGTEETNTTLHTNCTQIIFKNEQTSGVGVENKDGPAPVQRRRLCESTQHLCIRLVICGPDNKVCVEGTGRLKGH